MGGAIAIRALLKRGSEMIPLLLVVWPLAMFPVPSEDSHQLSVDVMLFHFHLFDRYLKDEKVALDMAISEKREMIRLLSASGAKRQLLHEQIHLEVLRKQRRLIVEILEIDTIVPSEERLRAIENEYLEKARKMRENRQPPSLVGPHSSRRM
jgi:hypothetical protein